MPRIKQSDCVVSEPLSFAALTTAANSHLVSQVEVPTGERDVIETVLLAAADRNAVAVQTQGDHPVAEVTYSPRGVRCQARIINGDFILESGHVFIT